MRCIHFCCITIFIFISLVGTNELLSEDEYLEDKCSEDECNVEIPHHRGKRAVIAPIENILRRILKNGIPDLNIDPLDSIYINGTFDIPLPEVPGVILVNNLTLQNINITGLSNFVAKRLEIEVQNGLGIGYDLIFYVHAHADYINFDFLIGDMIPLYGNGTLELDVALRIYGSIVTTTVSSENSTSWIILKDITADISIESTTFNISNIMNEEGTQFAKTFNNVMSEASPSILNKALETMQDMKEDLIKSVLETVNNLLDDLKLTPSDIVNCFTNIGPCKLDVF